jgi:hypothetical protein
VKLLRASSLHSCKYASRLSDVFWVCLSEWALAGCIDLLNGAAQTLAIKSVVALVDHKTVDITTGDYSTALFIKLLLNRVRRRCGLSVCCFQGFLFGMPSSFDSHPGFKVFLLDGASRLQIGLY